LESEKKTVRFRIETEVETDGRWIAEIREIPGALAHGKTEAEAKANAVKLASRLKADEEELGAYQDALVRKGLGDVRAGRVVSHDAVVERFRKLRADS
jgi:predicted RNase H-like HicB family nuclease